MILVSFLSCTSFYRVHCYIQPRGDIQHSIYHQKSLCSNRHTISANQAKVTLIFLEQNVDPFTQDPSNPLTTPLAHGSFHVPVHRRQPGLWGSRRHHSRNLQNAAPQQVSHSLGFDLVSISMKTQWNQIALWEVGNTQHNVCHDDVLT